MANKKLYFLKKPNQNTLSFNEMYAYCISRYAINFEAESKKSIFNVQL